MFKIKFIVLCRVTNSVAMVFGGGLGCGTNRGWVGGGGEEREKRKGFTVSWLTILNENRF